jgi:hypothetical protein
MHTAEPLGPESSSFKDEIAIEKVKQRLNICSLLCLIHVCASGDDVRSLCRGGAIKPVVGELEKCKLDLVGVQEVRWEREGYQIADNYTVFYGKENVNHHLRIGFFVHDSIILALKRVEFVSDRMSYITLKGHWCGIIVLNVHASTENKDDIIKDSVYEELEQLFDQFHRYHTKILLDFNAKVGKEDIFKPIIGNES